jgi:hypothetical protein
MPKQTTLRREFDTTKATFGTDIKRPEKGHAVIITAEVPPELERAGDVIRAAGMKLPKEVPLLAQHLHVAADGSPTVIGKASNFRRTKIGYEGHTCEAIAADIMFAEESELAQKYAKLFPTYIKDVSVGVRIIDGKPLNAKDAYSGYDYTETELFELSVVTVPCNPAASVIRTLKDTFGDQLAIPETGEMATLKQLQADLKALTETVAKNTPESTWKAAEATSLFDLLKDINSRLDDLEGLIEAARAEGSEQRDGRTLPKSNKIDLDDLKAYLDQLK